MGSRTMPSMCPHGVTVDWGAFGEDPDDGTVGADMCAVCDADEHETDRLRQENRLLRLMVQVYADLMKRVLEATHPRLAADMAAGRRPPPDGMEKVRARIETLLAEKEQG